MDSKRLDQGKQAAQKLENLVKNNYIFMHSSALHSPNIVNFIKNIISALNRNDKKIYMTKHVYDIIKNTKQGKLLQENKCIAFVKPNALDASENSVLVSNIAQYKVQHKILLITSDSSIAEKILNENNSRANKGKHIDVMNINKYGFLSGFNNLDKNNNNLKKSNTKNQHLNSYVGKKLTPVHPEQKFSLEYKEVNSSSKQIYNVTQIPKEGDIVTVLDVLNNKICGDIRLESEITDGGEGVIYKTENQNILAKIYKKDKLTEGTLKKIMKIIKKDYNKKDQNNREPHIMFPLAIIVNQLNECVGFLMKRASGARTPHECFRGGNATISNFIPKWKKDSTVILCLSILNEICFLHQRNIYLCDMNLKNFVFKSPVEVYLVDTDSYQIENLPCNVGDSTFISPEMYRKLAKNPNLKYSDFLRTKSDENYALAVLLFSIMLPGQTPYYQKGCEGEKYFVENQMFPFPFRKNDNWDKIPSGNCAECWDNLSYNIKENFYETFQKGGKYSTPDKRLSVEDWIKIFEEYHQFLQKKDNKSASVYEIMPTVMKETKSAIKIKCKMCGRKTPKNKNNICYECLNSTFEKRKCIDCSKEFTITYKEKQGYDDHNYDYPKRCKDCREIRKQKKEGNVASVDINNLGKETTSKDTNILSKLKNILNLC